MVKNVQTRWAPSLHRFGQKFDHSFLSVTWRWKTKKQATEIRNRGFQRDGQSIMAVLRQRPVNQNAGIRRKLRVHEAVRTEGERRQRQQALSESDKEGNLRFQVGDSVMVAAKGNQVNVQRHNKVQVKW